jgi:hypothetical protein
MVHMKSGHISIGNEWRKELNHMVIGWDLEYFLEVEFKFGLIPISNIWDRTESVILRDVM